MSNPEKSYKGCGVVILALFILSVATNVWLIKRGQVEPEPQVVIEHDTLMVEVPVEQKRYDDSLYTAWVSGFRPALDSIRLHQPEITTTITETIVKKAPRLSVGLSVGPGVSITGTPQAGIFVGFTANYRLWPK